MSSYYASFVAALDRDSWLRVLLVLQAPRAAFSALRDDSEQAAAARAEPVAALAFLAGVAVVLAALAGEALDDPGLGGLDVAALALIAGAFLGFAGYWLLGAVLHRGVRRAGGTGSARRSRHLLAFAVAPLALSLVAIWPLQVALYGEDRFRSGGSDGGAGGLVFHLAELGFAAWSAALVVVGVRVIHGLSLPRTLAAVVPAAALVALLVLLEAL